MITTNHRSIHQRPERSPARGTITNTSTFGCASICNRVGTATRCAGREPTGDSEGKQMAEAVLQLAVTYRKVIMPLIAATEKRLDLDHTITKRLEQLLAKANEPRMPPVRSPKKAEGGPYPIANWFDGKNGLQPAWHLREQL